MRDQKPAEDEKEGYRHGKVGNEAVTVGVSAKRFHLLDMHDDDSERRGKSQPVQAREVFARRSFVRATVGVHHLAHPTIVSVDRATLPDRRSAFVPSVPKTVRRILGHLGQSCSSTAMPKPVLP